MSHSNVSFQLSEDYENFQSKSIQGKLFDHSSFRNLQGDNEQIDKPSLMNIFISNEKKQLDTSHNSDQVSQRRHNEEIFLDQSSSKRKSSEVQFSCRQIQQAELSKSSSKQNLEEFNVEQNQNEQETQSKKKYIDEPSMGQKNSSLFENKNGKLEKKHLQQVSNNNKEIFLKTNTQIRSRQKTVQNLNNFQRGVEIIKSMIAKSMNRVYRINQIAQTFIMKSKFRIYARDISTVSQSQLELLNDTVYFHQKLANKKFTSLIFSKISNFLERLNQIIPVFIPTSSLRIYWDIFQIIFIYIFTYIFSILVVFCSNQADSQIVKQYFTTALIVFVLDFLVNLNTAYFNEEILVINRKQIILKYLKSNILITDILSQLVMGTKIFFSNQGIIYNPSNDIITYIANFLIMLKLNGISEKRNRFFQVFTLKEYQKHIFRLLSQLLLVISVAHIGKILIKYQKIKVKQFLQIKVSLAWYYLGTYEMQSQNHISWVVKFNIDNLHYMQKYIYSMYWSITTMTTVGYGDISASNYVEALFISISMILFSCLFAYSINNIGFILQEIEKSSKQLNDNITTVQRQQTLIQYIHFKILKKQISQQKKCEFIIENQIEEQKDRNQQAENEILKLLSNNLRDEITIEVNFRIINNCSFFSANFSNQTLRKLPFIMKEVLISPNEIIFEQEDVEDQSIYFIENGIVEIYQVTPPDLSGSKNYNMGQVSTIKQLKKNDLFGEISFFSGLARKACARSINLSTLYKINRDEFIGLIKENQEDFERFKMIEDQIKIQQDLFQIHVECYTCHKVGHISSECPKIHKVIDRQFKILKYNFSVFQNRGKHLRKISKKPLNPKLIIKQNKIASKQLQENLRYFNTYTQILFETDAEILSQCSIKIQKSSDQEYQTDSGQSSFNRDSQTSITENYEDNSFKNIPSSDGQKRGQKKSKTLKQIKKTQTILKKDESMKEIKSSFKDLTAYFRDDQNVESNIFQDRNILLNNQVSKNKIKSQKFNSQKCIQNMEQCQIDIFKDENKNLKDKLPDSVSNSKSLHSNEKNVSIELDETNQSQKVIQQSQSIPNQEGSNKKYTRKTQKDLTSFLNKKQITTISNNDIQSEDHRSSSSNLKQFFSSKKNSNLLCNDQSMMPPVDLQQSNLSLKHFFDGNDLNSNFEETINKFENYFRNINTQLDQGQSLENKMINDLQFEYFFQFLQNLKKNNCSLPQQKAFPSFKKTESYLNFDQNNLQFLKQSVQSDQNQTLSDNFKKVKKQQTNQTNVSILSSNQQCLQQLQQNQDSPQTHNLVSEQFIFEKFDQMKSFNKFYPHNNFEKIISCLKLKKNVQFKNQQNVKMPNKKRRQNIILLKSKISRGQSFLNNLLQNNFPSEINLDSYRPTYLSYGTSQRSQNIYPKQQPQISPDFIIL